VNLSASNTHVVAPDELTQLNVEVPGRLADLANDFGSLLIYISTDYVFDGKNPPYDVRDKVNPLNTYGTSKLWSMD
jgi:S-adenosylmethionine synthetase